MEQLLQYLQTKHSKDLVRVASNVVQVSIYCQFGISTSVSKSELMQVMHLQMTGKTAVIQYEPITSLAIKYSLLVQVQL